MFPKLEIALNTVSRSLATHSSTFGQLLETIEKNGEYQKYVIMLAEREEQAHRDLRRRERARKRLEFGDNYQSENESLDNEEEKSEEDDDDSDYDDEEQSVSYSDMADQQLRSPSSLT